MQFGFHSPNFETASIQEAHFTNSFRKLLMTHFLALAFKLCFDLTGIESALVLFIVPLYYSLSGTATLRVAVRYSHIKSGFTE